MSLVVTCLVKRFDGAPRAVLDQVSFQVSTGSLTCLLGPSGVGKTTLLHIVAGLVTADAGTVQLDGDPIDALPTHRRPLTLLMQQPQLFAHLDVIDNVAFGLRVRGVGRRQRLRTATELLELVGIEHLAHRRTQHLSGGEQQRVALARALAVRPRLLLADEPFASVDTDIRRELQNLLHDVQTELGTTILMVTHDEDEASQIAAHRLRLRDGAVAVDEPRHRGARSVHARPTVDHVRSADVAGGAPAPLRRGTPEPPCHGASVEPAETLS